MPCEDCKCQFTIFKRKKSCSDCRRLYCVDCLKKSRSKVLCERCALFAKRPLTRSELSRCKAKDLIIYLQSKHIPTSGCVEKEDLINLVLAHVDTSPSNSSSSPTGSDGGSTFRSYLNQFSAPRMSQSAGPQAQTQTQGSRRPSNDNNSYSSFFGRNTNQQDDSAGNAFTFLRQGCKILFENISDKVSNTNFGFEGTSGSGTAGSNSANVTRSPSGMGSPPAEVPSFHEVPSSSEVNTMARNGSSNLPRADSYPKPRDRQKVKPKLLTEEPGCDCSDDEQAVLLRRTSQSTNNLLYSQGRTPMEHLDYMPGPSRINQSTKTSGVPFESNSNTLTSSSSAEFSSFEELAALADNSTNTPQVAATEVRNAISKPESGASSTSANRERDPGTPWAVNRGLQRRHSDGHLMTTGSSGSLLPSPVMGPVERDIAENVCCNRCGKRKNELDRRLRRFRDQLTELSLQDEEMRKHLEAILAYLDKVRLSSRTSFNDGVHNDDDENSEIDPNVIRPPLAGPRPTTEQTDKPNILYKRKFIKLDDIQSSADLEDLSVKQLKEILMLNRVDFKGCCEKNELIERVQRLLHEYHACPSVEKLPSDDLCKICMDAPIECVILECGHLATCTNCGKVLSECPLCRQYIVRVVRFFRA